MTATATTKNLILALTAAALLLVAPPQALAGPRANVRKAPVIKRVKRSFKRALVRHKVRRAENKAFRKLLRTNKDAKKIYKAQKKAQGTGMLRLSKWFNLSMGAINSGIGGVLISTGNPLGALNIGIGVWSNTHGLDAAGQLQVATSKARSQTLQKVVRQGHKLDPVLAKAFRRDRIAGRVTTTSSSSSSAPKMAAEQSSVVKQSSARQTPQPRRTVIDRTPLSSMGAGLKDGPAPANKPARLGLSTADLSQLRSYGVEYQGAKDQFRLRMSGKYSGNAAHWVQTSGKDGALLSKDGQFRYHRPRRVNGGRLPAFVEKLQ